MFVKKGKKLTEEEIFDFLRNLKPELSKWTLRDYSYQFMKVNDNLLQNAGVYGIEISGGNYYSIVYVDDLLIRHVWMPRIHDLIGAYINEEENSKPFFCFRPNPNIFGMDKLLQATDKFFSFLRGMGGCYAQIDLL